MPRRKDARVFGRHDCGLGAWQEARATISRFLPNLHLLHLARKKMGSSWQPAALGSPVNGKAKPQGPLATVKIMKKRVTRQFACYTPRLPLPMVTIIQVPPPSPLQHNKQSKTGYSLTTEVNLNGTIEKSGELEGTRHVAYPT